MKKLLALLLALMLALGAVPALGEASADTSADAAAPEAAALPAVGEVVHGFEVKEIRPFDMIGATLVLFEHQKTGGTLMYIANGDTNRAFQLSFKTRPQDDTGLPHVFEHATLYGSEKYPSKTLLFNAMYQTYNTYINAYTTDAMTSYPLGSLSEAQLLALADWYIDACFHPNIMTDEGIYKTQAWHYEMLDADSPLTLEGTVYSEMTGAMTLERTALDNANKVTFPGASISYQYGGLPAAIPDMTWDMLKNYHNLYYHPSNCMAFLYGAFDDYAAFLQLLDTEYAQYDRQEFTQAEASYQAITAPVEQVFDYPTAAGSDTAHQSMVVYYILLPGLKGNVAEEQVLDHLCSLLGAEGSPLTQELKKALPTGTFSVGREVAGPDDAVIFTAEHVDAADAGVFRDTVQAALRSIHDNGLDEALVDALAANLRLNNKLAGESGSPIESTVYALAYYAACSGNPFQYVDNMEAYDALAQENADGLYVKAIANRLLDPALYTLTVTRPAPGEKEKADEALAAKLAEIKAGMSAEEIAAIVAETNAQPAEEDNSELLARLKAVDAASLPEEVKTYPIADSVGADGVRHIDVTAGVDGVGQAELLFDARALPQEDIHYMRLFTRLLGQMDTAAHRKEELGVLMDRYLPGRTIGVQVDPGQTSDEVQPWLVAQWTALDEDLEAGYGLMMELLRDTDFTDTAVLSERISAQAASVRSQISNASYQVLVARGLGRDYMYQRYYAYLNFVDYYAFLTDLQAKMAENPQEAVDGLKRVQAFLLNRFGAVAGFAGSEESIALNRPLADAFMAQLPLEEREKAALNLEAAAATEGLIVDTNTGFNALIASFEAMGQKADEGLQVITSLVADQLLTPILRDQMGVYTPWCSVYDEDKGLYLISYRDPNVKETFNVYESLPEMIAGLQVDQETLDGYILSCYAALAKPAGELTGAVAEINRVLARKPADRVLTRMRQLKQVTPESFQTAADLFKKAWETGYKATAAGAGAVQANADLYENVLNPFGAVDAGSVTLADVPEDREDFAAIRFAYENGLLAADAEGRFRPDDPASAGDLYAALYVLAGGAPGAVEEAMSVLPQYGLAPEASADTPLTFGLRDQVMAMFGAGIQMELAAIGEGRADEVMTRAQLAQDLTMFDGE